MGDEAFGLQVFVSWSGPRSHAMAEVVRRWLEAVIQATEPWLSSADLRSGAGWRRKLEDKLRVTKTGILCITPASQTSSWLVFEAGALSKTEDEAVCPLLVPGMLKSELQEPLASFQSTRADDKDEVFQLARTVNARLPEGRGRLTDERLRHSFEREWPAFLEGMKKAGEVAEQHVPARSVPDKQEEMFSLLRGIDQDMADLKAMFRRDLMRFRPGRSAGGISESVVDAAIRDLIVKQWTHMKTALGNAPSAAERNIEKDKVDIEER